MKKWMSGLGAIIAIGATLPAWAEDAQGLWSGAIGGALTVVLDVGKTAGGTWEATLSSPSQARSAKVEQFTTDATHLGFMLAGLNASYQATWNEQTKAWTGTWTQGRQAPLNLKRIEPKAAAALQPRRPQEAAIAAATAPYASEEVRFAGAGVQLAGTLFLPKGAGPWPAVVLVHGSGPHTRDEDVMGHKIFQVLADHLARQGIAVLRYDKRGIGSSTGNYENATTLDFADDAQAAAAFLRTRPGIDSRHIGMVGHSEGGLIAPIVAAREPQLGFVVMMAGPGVRGELLMVEQLALSAESQGAKADLIDRQRKMHRTLFSTLVAERDPAQANIKATAILEQGERDGLSDPGTAAAKANAFTSPWFLAFLGLEPGTALQAMRQPVLALNGELDRQVPSGLDLDAIRTALANNPRAMVKELPKLNHLFQTAATGAGEEYAQIEETLAPSALAEISNWIRVQANNQ
jgi:pimeloyl-ACP methyl ester carboxylesterase